MTEIERPFLAAKGFNTNSVQCLPLYYVIISKVHVFFFTCTISHVHRLAQFVIFNPWKVPELNSLFSKFFCFITWFVISPD